MSQTGEQAQRHLVLLPEHPAEALLAYPLLLDIHHQYPDIPLDVLATPALTGLVARFQAVDQYGILPDKGAGWGAFWRAGQALQNAHYRRAWVLPLSVAAALIPFAANIPVRTGYRGPYRYGLLNDIRLPRRRHHLLKRYRALLGRAAADVPPLPGLTLKVDWDNQQRLLQQYRLQLDRPVAIWTPEPSAATGLIQAGTLHLQLIQSLLQEGWQVWLCASRHAQAAIQALLSVLDEPARSSIHNLMGQLSWTELVDLLALGQVQLSEDNPLALLGAVHQLPVYLPVAKTSATVAESLLSPALGARCLPVASILQAVRASLNPAH